MQNYCLFHKFHDSKELSDTISGFIEERGQGCLNIYSYKVDHLWEIFVEQFHFVEAAGGIVTRANGDMLLIRRNGHWDAPKGHFEPGESPIECARREIREECGVVPGRLRKELRPTYHIYRYGGEFYMKMTHWFMFDSEGQEETTPQAEEGITEASWIGHDRLAAVKEGMWSSVKDVLNEVLATWGSTGNR